LQCIKQEANRNRVCLRQQFSWISPRFYPDFGKQARDQHPDHPVYEGEDLIAEVYAAVRNSPKWNETALMIFYDENGAFYDHCPPVDNIPNPTPGQDATDIDPPFNFTRGGPRVPCIIVSPWVKKGTVVHDPVPGRRGGYEATSIFNTLRDLWGFENKPLTARQAWASSWAYLFDTESSPRTDCPTSVPTPNITSEERAKYAAQSNAKPPSGLQREFYELVEALHGRDGSGFERFKTKIELGRYVSEQHRLFIEKKKNKKEAAEPKKKIFHNLKKN
jgi:phospholipase C